MTLTPLPDDLLAQLQSRHPLLWLNPLAGSPLPQDAPAGAIAMAEARLARCEPLMAALFPELAASAGKIESPLMPADNLPRMLSLPAGTRRLVHQARRRIADRRFDQGARRLS